MEQLKAGSKVAYTGGVVTFGKKPASEELNHKQLKPVHETYIWHVINQPGFAPVYLIQHQNGELIEFYENQKNDFGDQDYDLKTKGGEGLKFAHVYADSLISLEKIETKQLKVNDKVSFKGAEVIFGFKAPDYTELDNRFLLPLKTTTICFMIEQQQQPIMYLIQHNNGNPIEFFEQQQRVFGIQEFFKLDRNLNYAHVYSESLILLEEEETPEQPEQLEQQLEQKTEQIINGPSIQNLKNSTNLPEQPQKELGNSLKRDITEFIEKQTQEEPQQTTKVLEVEGELIKIGEIAYLLPKDVKEHIDFLESENVRFRAQLYLTKGIED